MFYQVLKIFDIEVDKDLKIMRQGQDLFDIASGSLTAIKPVLEEVNQTMSLCMATQVQQ